MSRTRLLGLLLVFSTLVGCITIEENYTFKKNGSGTMEYVVDMSQFGEMMKAFESMSDGKDKGKKPDGLDKLDLKDEMAALKGIPGIKKVKVKSKDEYVQRLSFAFADLTALNAALNVLLKDTTGQENTFFTWEGNTLVRKSNGHARNIGLGMGNEEEESDSTGAGEILSTMKYKYSFTFAEPVANTLSGDGVEVERTDDRTVKLSTDFEAISKDERALDLRIDILVDDVVIGAAGPAHCDRADEEQRQVPGRRQHVEERCARHRMRAGGHRRRPPARPHQEPEADRPVPPRELGIGPKPARQHAVDPVA